MSGSLAEEIAHSLRAMGRVDVTRFFAGSGLRLRGVQFAFIMKGVLYLRVSPAMRRTFEALGCRPFSYAKGARKVIVSAYYEAPPDAVDEPFELARWAAEAHRAALQAEARKPPSRGKRTGTRAL